MKLTSTLLIALGFLTLANVAQAAVITTAEWESKPGAPWTYAGTVLIALSLEVRLEVVRCGSPILLEAIVPVLARDAQSI